MTDGGAKTSRHGDRQSLIEHDGPNVGDFDDASVPPSADPPASEYVIEQRCSEGTTHVVLPVGPIEAHSHEWPSSSAQLVGVDAEAGKPRMTAPGQAGRTVDRGNEFTALQGAQEINAQLAAEMVVAGSSVAEVCPWSWPLRGIRLGKIHRIDPLEEVGYLGRSQPEESVPTGRLHRYETGVDD